MLAGIAFALVLAVLAAKFAEIVVVLRFAPPIKSFLVFAPKGLAKMAVLALGADFNLKVEKAKVGALVAAIIRDAVKRNSR